MVAGTSGSSGSPFAAFSAPQCSIVAKLRAALREKLQRVAEDDARDSPWYVGMKSTRNETLKRGDR